MARNHSRIRAAAIGMLLGFAATVALADVNSALRAYQSTTTRATQVMAGMNDAASAKAGAQQLQGAMTQQHAAEATLHTELLKLNLNDKNNAQVMETTTAAMAKVNEPFSTQQARILGNPAIADVVGKVFAQQRPLSKAH